MCNKGGICLTLGAVVAVFVCAQAVAQWQAKLESVEPDVQRVMADEREETALRKAEMEANKASVGGVRGF